MLCMACLRFKFSPIHWLVRMIGICPGDRKEALVRWSSWQAYQEDE